MDAIEKMNAIQDYRDSAIKKTLSYATPKVVAAVFEIIISALCIAGIQLVSINFKWERLAEPKFWIKVCSMVVCIFILYRAVINARFPATEKRANVIKAKEEYEEKVKNKELDLKDFLEDFNLKTKVTVYVAKINNKIAKLIKKQNKAKRDNTIIKLDLKIKRLKELITTEYIQEHIDAINVNYPVVFYSDFNDCDTFESGNIITRGSQAYAIEFNKSSVKTIWCYVLSTAIIALGLPVWGEDATVLSTVISLGMTICSVITRIATAMMKADRLYDATITKSYLDKSAILDEYAKWKENNVSQTKLQEALDKQEKELKEKYDAKFDNAIKNIKDKLNVN